MCEIKLITRETEFKGIELMPWDSCHNDVELHVYRIPGYIHSIGGKWGNNNYWCCKRGEKPTYENLYEFSGNVCNWGIMINENNYHRFKWNEHEIESSIRVEIIRNKKVFYTFVVNNFDYGLVKARKLLFEINEHPISFNEINYEKQIIGRKILFKNTPCIIDEYSMNNNLCIYPENEFQKEFNKKYEDGFVVDDLFSNSIDWFREKVT